MKNTTEEIFKLSKMLDKGQITQEEFNVLKKDLIKKDDIRNNKRNKKTGLGLGTPTPMAGGRKPMKPLKEDFEIEPEVKFEKGKYSADSDLPLQRKPMKPDTGYKEFYRPKPNKCIKEMRESALPKVSFSDRVFMFILSAVPIVYALWFLFYLLILWYNWGDL